MKTRIIIFNVLFVLLLSFISCTGVKTVSRGLDSQAYIEIIGSPQKYNEGLYLFIDNNKQKLIKPTKNIAKQSGVVYAVSPGVHEISITYINEQIYKKTIFISSQETKQILLP